MLLRFHEKGDATMRISIAASAGLILCAIPAWADGGQGDVSVTMI